MVELRPQQDTGLSLGRGDTDKVDEVVEIVEETVVELLVEALEAEEIFRQRPQQDTRVSLGPVFNHFAAAGGSSTKAFDPCLDTGEVGEGPAVGEVEEPGVESPVDGRVRAIRDKSAGRVEDFPGPVVCNKSWRSSRSIRNC